MQKISNESGFNALKPVVTAVLVLQLGACAVVSKSDCIEGNWQKMGYKAGFDGIRDVSSAYLEYAKICSKHGAEVDQSSFGQGHSEGIEDFCESDNAVRLGARGSTRAMKEQVCPEDDYPGFEPALTAGLKLHRLRVEARRAESEYQRVQNVKSNGYQLISNLQSRLNSGSISRSERSNLERRLRTIRRDINSAQRREHQARNRFYKLRDAAERYQSLLEMEYPEAFN